MPVITISGMLGSGAREIGQTVAARLGLDFIDQQILVDAASRLGVPVEAVSAQDEPPATLRERLTGMLRVFLERSAASGDPLSEMSGIDSILARSYVEAGSETTGKKQEVADADYLKTTTALLREIAALGGAVILGRGSQVILRDTPNVLHVLVIATYAARLRRYSEREGAAKEDTTRVLQESDRALQAFHRKFWKVDVNDPRLYDITCNLERLTTEAAVEGVVAAAGRVAAAR